MNMISKAILLGIGLISMTREKIDETVNDLIRRGEVSEEEGRQLVREMIDKSRRQKEDMERWMEKALADTMKRLNIPSRSELDELRDRVRRLEAERAAGRPAE